MSNLKSILEDRILVLDGAMGTMLQNYAFQEKDFHSKRFADFPVSLQRNNDLLSLSQAQAIKEIHAEYFAAGVDIVEKKYLFKYKNCHSRLPNGKFDL
jgi:5-methyltetrahydrofolate--homocysteine methyltransferase